MKIISNFKDVYDQCAVHGIDVDTVYHRFTQLQKVKLEGDFSVMKGYISSANSYKVTFERHTPFHRFGSSPAIISPMFLVVGEQVVPHVAGISYRDMDESFVIDGGKDSLGVDDGAISISSGENIYSPLGRTYSCFEDVVEDLRMEVTHGYLCQKSKLDKPSGADVMAQLMRSRTYGYRSLDYDEMLTPFKDERWAAAIGEPLALVLPSVVLHQKPLRKDRAPKKVHGALIIKNPSMRSLCLTALMDPYTIHQEISMAMNGFLANREDDGVTVSDENRMKAKGFDDISFKTRKGSKKPRRR